MIVISMPQLISYIPVSWYYWEACWQIKKQDSRCSGFPFSLIIQGVQTPKEGTKSWRPGAFEELNI
jgi:hypothetical protein